MEIWFKIWIFNLNGLEADYQGKEFKDELKIFKYYEVLHMFLFSVQIVIF